ncbi:MAG: MBL fold metallo-hydrolase [Bacterioplanes sp.]|nr:MBL fold metallo-hydrolase [Bacterioplanes sp.]
MTLKSAQYSLIFHGTGSGGELSMGCSAATLMDAKHNPLLLIDCGPGTVSAFQQQFNQLPAAVFITHGHMDHIADLEILAVRAHLQKVPPIRLYVPLSLIGLLHQRLATYPGLLAEGGLDFWQSFQLLPVTDHFHWAGLTFQLWPTRHHAPGSSFALHVPGLFLYSGDTRPIPEIVHHQLSGQEVVFHDCGVEPNPSHTGLADLAREYQPNWLHRFVLYHYANAEAATLLRQAGYTVAAPKDIFTLPARGA